MAEDNDLNYEVEQELLGMYGITCERAANGEICVDKFHRAEPETNCQGLFNQIHKKSTKKVPEAPYGS